MRGVISLKVTFITGNRHKLSEAERIFHGTGIELEHADIGYPELQGTLEEVARFGAEHAARVMDCPVIVEDAGLFIRALKWFPGPYSAYVQDTIGNSGILKLMENVEDRYAEFRSAVGFCTPNSEPEVFLGVVKGRVGTEERGTRGFAFDPLFYPEGMDKSFGEISTSEKNRFSHRSRALKKFARWFIENYEVI